MNKFLFEEFDQVTAAAWKQKIQVDLKGADYNDTLLWHTNEGITVRPFYHAEDAAEIANLPSNNWRICQQITVVNVEEANAQAAEYISKGAESIYFQINTVVNWSELLKNINVSTIEFQFNFNVLNKGNIEALLALNLPHCLINIDIIGQLARTGNWYESTTSDHVTLETLVQAFPNHNILSVDTGIYQNAGANITQQLAYAMAHANEYLNHLDQKNLLTPDFKITFKVATGSNYFFEIAKIKALRLLWEALAKEYNVATTCNILAVPSLRNKTIYDYNVNMLRTTTECMSAVLGGANTICNLPYDYIYHNSNEFGERIARNQLLVLKAESGFDQVQNPADGTYYINTITKQLAEKALEVLKLIEQGGGFLSQLLKGIIQRKIAESASKEQEQFEAGSLVLLGTNKYPNDKDQMKGDLEKSPFMTQHSRKTLIEPIVAKRLAESLEEERLSAE